MKNILIMKRILFIALTVICLAVSQTLLLDNSEGIAARFATPYSEIGDKATQRLAKEYGPSEELIRQYGPDHKTVLLSRIALYRAYVSEYVEPIQRRFEARVILVFSILYVLLALLAVKMVFDSIQKNGGICVMLARMTEGASRRLGLKGLKSRYELTVSEREFHRLKNLFENELISRQEFEEGKAEIKERIRRNDLFKNAR